MRMRAFHPTGWLAISSLLAATVVTLVTPSISASAAASDPVNRAGARSFYTYVSQSLADRLSVKVNVGTGGLLVARSELSVPQVSGDLPVGEVYNSLMVQAASTVQAGPLGYGWRLSTGVDVRLRANGDGTVTYFGSSGYAADFAVNGAGWNPPAGLDVDLTKPNTDATHVYKLAGHVSAQADWFDAAGNPTLSTDRNGNTTTFGYAAGLNTTITGSRGNTSGRVVNLAYTGSRLSGLTQTAGALTRTVSYSTTVSGSNDMDRVTDAAGTQTGFTYAENGAAAHELTTILTPSNRRVEILYDASHRVTQLKNDVGTGHLNAATTFAYSTDGSGNPVTTVTDPLAHATTYTLDTTGRVTKAVDPLGRSVSATWTTNNQVSTLQNASGGTSTNTFGANAGANGNESLTSAADPTGATNGATYSCTGATKYLPDTTVTASGSTTLIQYDGPGNTTSLTAGHGSQNAATAFVTVAGGKVNSSTDPLNGAPAPGTACTPSSSTPVGNFTSYNYDSVNNLTSVTPPTVNSLGVRSYSYDGFGRLATLTTGKAVTQTFTRDKLDRVTKVAYSDGAHDVFLRYNADGQKTVQSDAAAVTTFTYDAAGRQVARQQAAAVASGSTPTAAAAPACPTASSPTVLCYGYDVAGNMTYASDTDTTNSKTSYSYDSANQVDALTDQAGKITIFGYTNDGQRADTWAGASGVNGTFPPTYTGGVLQAPAGYVLRIHADFNTGNRLTHLLSTRASSGTTKVSELTYSYTIPAGTSCPGATAGAVTDKRQTVTDNITGVLTSYCYDSVGRLTRVTVGSTVSNFTYDADGNRTDTTTGAAGYNSANQPKAAGHTFDADGNQTAPTPYVSTGYNGTDQTTTFNNGSTYSMGYLGADQSERTKTGLTVFANGRLGLQSEANGANKQAFIRDPHGTLVETRFTGTGAGTYYFVPDGLGSILNLIKSDGTVAATYTYDSWGTGLSTTGTTGVATRNTWRWAGGYLDGTGLYHFGQRFYQPASGRWSQQDTIERPGDPTQGNRYAYTGADPINFTDPAGMWWLSSLWQGAKCVASIAVLVGGIALPALKVAKVAAGYGGLIFTARLVMGAGTVTEILTILGGGLVAIAADILGVQGIIDNC